MYQRVQWHIAVTRWKCCFFNIGRSTKCFQFWSFKWIASKFSTVFCPIFVLCLFMVIYVSIEFEKHNRIGSLQRTFEFHSIVSIHSATKFSAIHKYWSRISMLSLILLSAHVADAMGTHKNVSQAQVRVLLSLHVTSFDVKWFTFNTIPF